MFEQSPEGQALCNEGLEPGWARMMLEFGMHYLGVTPPQMSPDDVRAILFDLFPRKVSASADEAPDIIIDFPLAPSHSPMPSTFW